MHDLTLRCLPLLSIPILFFLSAGCTMPRYAISLNDVLDQERRGHRTPYKYRCTIGAHRGASETYKENTLAALVAADQDEKYAFVEFDVQYSKDKKVVVFHDKRLHRLFGSMRSIGKTTYAKLSEITRGEIAAYDEVMDRLSKKKINIEIKSQGDAYEDERLVDEVLVDLRARKRDRDVLISSISRDVVEYVNRVYPDIPTGQVFWLTSSTYVHLDGLTEGLYEEIGESEADYLMLHVSNLRNIDDLLKLKPKKKTVVFWDFDDEMYVVHKDFSDRLWGDSGFRTFYKTVRYKLSR